MFGWKQWDKNLLHFKGQDIKILEIGVYKGDAMEKFAEIFLERNKNAEYYGIDTWEGSPEYVEIDFKEVERIAIEKRNKSPAKNRIHYLKKESSIALPELVIKGIMFDIIFIDASHTAKDVLYDGILSFKILKKNGIIIFDDYLWSKLEPNIFTPKPAIDAILDIHKDELDILYIGYQVIIKKTDIKFKPKVKDSTIIYELIESLNYYWKDTEMKETLTLLSLKEIPDFKVKIDKSSNIKIRRLENIEIFYTLGITDFMYTYYKLNDVKEELIKELNNNNIDIINELLSYSAYGLYGIKFIKYINVKGCNTTLRMLPDLINLGVKQEKILNILINNNDNHKYNIENTTVNSIDINKYFLNNTIDELIDDLKKENKMYNCITGFHMLNRGNYQQMYNLILMQMIIVRNKLNINGQFQIDLSDRYDFINDFILLLNIIFKKVIISTHSNKIGRLNLFIYCKDYIGMNNSIYNMIINTLKENKDNEIIGIFDSKSDYINIEALENTVFNYSKKITKIIENNSKLIVDNKDKIIESIRKRTINSIYDIVLKINQVNLNN